MTAPATNSRSDLDGAFGALCVLLAPGALQRRQPHPVARGQPIGRLGAPAVYAHFARSQDAIDQAARHGAEGAQQEIIETLAVVAFLRLDVADWADWKCT